MRRSRPALPRSGCAPPTVTARLPTKFWLSTLPASNSRAALVRQAMLRWRTLRDYQELKQEIGLSHDEGRGVPKAIPVTELAFMRAD